MLILLFIFLLLFLNIDKVLGESHSFVRLQELSVFFKLEHYKHQKCFHSILTSFMFVIDSNLVFHGTAELV